MKYLNLCALALLACSWFMTLDARGAGEFHGGGHSYGQGDYGHYGGGQHQNYPYYGGGYGTGGYAPTYPYPDPQSQPGMNDDSDALYNSYLRHNNNGY